MLYKITGPNGESIHGGVFTYPLPKDGNPGEWAADRHVDMCSSGYHLTSDVPQWWRPGVRVWEAEGRGEAKTLEDKTCFTSVRLTREITDADELATLHVFVSGAREIGCGKAVAFGSATVRASGSATVRASGSATVQAFGSATVQAFGAATVRASGSATVRASGSATVQAFGSATVQAFGSATVRAFGAATVEAFGAATVEAFGSATVISWQAKPNVKLTEKAVHVARGDGTAKPKIHVARKEK